MMRRLLQSMALGAAAWLLAGCGQAPPPFARLPAGYLEDRGALEAPATGARVPLRTAPAADAPDYVVLGESDSATLAVAITATDLQLYRRGPQAARWLAPARTPRAAGAATLFCSRRGDTAHLYYDGQLLASAPVPAGPVALRYLSPAADAPRLVVQRLPAAQMGDDFMRTDIAQTDAWTAVAGEWRTLWERNRQASPNPFVCQGTAPDSGGALVGGYLTWNHYTISAAVNASSATRAAGLLFGWQDAANHYRAGFVAGPKGDELRLVRVRAGAEQALVVAPLLLPAGRWVLLEVRVYEGQPLTVLVDGQRRLLGPADRDTSGKIGLAVSGSATFDDLRVDPAPPLSSEPAWRQIAATSQAYEHKPRFERDDRDDYLDRWAHDLDAWVPRRLTIGPGEFRAYVHDLPLFSDFDVTPRAAPPGAQVLLCDWQGRPQQALSVPADLAPLRRRGDRLFWGDRPAGQVPGGAGLRVAWGYAGAVPALPTDWRPRTDLPELRARTVIQELFDQAPVDWAPLSGTWGNTIRWKCNQNWNFFGGYGYDDVVLFSKLSFGGDQVHEFYFGMKDLYAGQLQNQRYVRRDVCFSFLTDGLNRNSGYTFMYGGHGNRGSFLYRGEKLVAENPKFRFLDTTGIDDLHRFWRCFRFELVGSRVCVLYEGNVVFDYQDPQPPPAKAGHLALWTQRNGIIYARLNSSAATVTREPLHYLPLTSDRTLAWRALDPFRVAVSAAGADRCEVRNRFGGGELAAEYPLAAPVDLNATPLLHLPLDVPAGTKVSLHVRVDGQSFIIPLTAPREATYRSLCAEATEPSPWAGTVTSTPNPKYVPDWLPFAAQPLPPERFGGGEPRRDLRDEWTGDLRAAAVQAGVALKAGLLERLVIGNSSFHEYLMAGFGGNAAGASYRVGRPRFAAAPAPTAAATRP